MKKLNYLFLALFAFSSFVFTACGDDEVEVVDIVDTALATDNLSLLAEAVTQANLASTLKGAGPFTVFAPTNDAFQALLDSNPAWSSLSDIDNATLENVLKFHVIAADVKAADLTDSYATTVATGPDDKQIVLQIDVTGGVKFNGSASPVTTDVEATNGTVHIIDEVMLPPSVVDLAVNNPNFSILVEALTARDLVTTLSGPGPFTVFAPTNAAFQALLDSNPDWNGLNDISNDVLDAVLTYHVVSGANVQAGDLSNGMQVQSLGGTFQVNLDAGAALETTGGQTVNISLTDLQGMNGVVHVVDAVLLP